MTWQIRQMWATLLKAGLVEGRQPVDTGTLDSPWYVKALLAFSGWLAALFFLGFLGIAFSFILRSTVVNFFIGTMMIGGAFFMFHFQKNEFLEHLSLAASLAGQVLVATAIFKLFDYSENGAWLTMSLLQATLAVLMPSFVHRVFSSFFAMCAFSMALSSMGISFMVSGIALLLASLCWLNEFSLPQQMEKIRAIGYGLVLALIPLKGSALFGSNSQPWRHSQAPSLLWIEPWMGEVLIALVTLYVVRSLLQRYDQTIPEPLPVIALLGTFLLCIISMEMHGITVGVVIILLGFSGSNRRLLGLGILSLLFYASYYYYLLDTTLLNKSLSLLIIGLVMFVFRWLMRYSLPVKKAAQHA
ncbi:MAG: DUF4401 domain-containing protein [Candidatus Riflebacteria bacterium]|nr:DUF4401 domain-containing protein [Candidatus Riflebacteria bacterium]